MPTFLPILRLMRPLSLPALFNIELRLFKRDITFFNRTKMKLVRTDGQWFAMVYDNFTTHDLDFFLWHNCSKCEYFLMVIWTIASVHSKVTKQTLKYLQQTTWFSLMSRSLDSVATPSVWTVSTSMRENSTTPWVRNIRLTANFNRWRQLVFL